MRLPYTPEPAHDMTSWPDGPWKREPAAIAWEDGRTGAFCAMIRNPLTGSWCGYVAVEPGHPAWGKSYRDRVELPATTEVRMVLRDFGIIDLALEMSGRPDGLIALGMALPAHGGISFSCEDTDGFWWFGFDCSHGGDLMPALMPFGTYRDQNYVHGQVTRLAWALQAMRVARKCE